MAGIANKYDFINQQLQLISIPYEFGEWTTDVKYPYFVGEQSTPEEITAEDGGEVTTIIINGFHRGKFAELELAKEKIKRLFNPISGLRAEIDSGSIAVFFDGSFYIPTGEADLKRIQINLKILEWKKGDF